MEIRTDRLVLHAVDRDEARRIADRTPAASDRWADDYPFAGDLAALGFLLQNTPADGDPRPFGYYQLRVEGRAIGGIGFKGPPADGSVEVGYGLVPSARGSGYAAEALVALVGVARDLGVRVVRADTEAENVASQRTLERAGFNRTAEERAFELVLA